MTPKRIQRRRTKGWRMPQGAVYVGRPAAYGNTFRVDRYVGGWAVYHGSGMVQPTESKRFAQEIATQECAASWARLSDAAPGSYDALVEPLRGRDLACWCRLCPAHAAGKPLGVTCPDCEPCHADVLLEIANAPEEATP